MITNQLGKNRFPVNKNARYSFKNELILQLILVEKQKNIKMAGATPFQTIFTNKHAPPICYKRDPGLQRKSSLRVYCFFVFIPFINFS